jgi:predicted PurR-regulated permease PerM
LRSILQTAYLLQLMQYTNISISTSTFVRFFLVAIVFWLAYSVRGVLLLLFIAFILATILYPLTERCEKYGIPRTITMSLVYIFALAAFVGTGWVLLPVIAHQISQIALNFGGYWDSAVTLLPPEISGSLKQMAQSNINSLASTAQSGISVTLVGLLSTVQGVVAVIASSVIVFVLSFYLVAEKKVMHEALLYWLPNEHVPFVERLLSNTQNRLGGWARGQIFLSLLIGVFVYIALSIIGVPYALALATLAMLLEFIPYVGPLLSSLFGIFFALTISPVAALITALVYYVIQIIENNLIIPKIMQKAAGVNPVLSMVVILLSLQVFGVIGIFLGVPIAALLVAILETIRETR